MANTNSLFSDDVSSASLVFGGILGGGATEGNKTKSFSPLLQLLGTYMSCSLHPQTKRWDYVSMFYRHGK